MFLMAMLDFSCWTIDFSNEFVSKTINFNLTFDREKRNVKF